VVGASKKERVQVSQMIVELVNLYGCVSLSMLYKEIPTRRDVIRSSAVKLTKAGVIKRVKRGIYCKDGVPTFTRTVSS